MVETKKDTQSKDEIKYGFLFGAGAEYCYGLPSGPDYTRESMLQKKPVLYDALHNFYKKHNLEYQKQFMFRKDSHAFCEIVTRAAKKCEEQKKYDKGTKDIIDLLSKCNLNEEEKKKFKEKVKDVYETIVENYDEKNKKYKTLASNFSYYGSIEKDFSTIINPKDAGEIKFYRLMNYFWSAYFSIINPILEHKGNYKAMDENNRYSYVLDNLHNIIKDIYSKEFLKAYKIPSKKVEGDYYTVINNCFSPECIITTNYTPFVEKIKNAKIHYLAGKLSTFESPDELKIYDLSQEENELLNLNGKFIFPYLLTQAPVKPIIETKQILEYARAIDSLKELDVLIILGYGINENDNHVNAILRNFALNEKKKIIYCEYEDINDKDKNDKKNKKDKEEIKEEIKEKLHLKNIKDSEPNIKILPHCGNAKKLCEKIKTELGC